MGAQTDRPSALSGGGVRSLGYRLNPTHEIDGPNVGMLGRDAQSGGAGAGGRPTRSGRDRTPIQSAWLATGGPSTRGRVEGRGPLRGSSPC